jgi:hypothetical protein
MELQTHLYMQVAHALAACQFIEQALKLYLTEALLLAKKCIGSKMPFSMTGEQYQDASLERLLGIFDKLNDNVALKKSLAAFKEERNFLTHRAIASCIDPGGDLDYGEASKLSPRLIGIEGEARRLAAGIHEEGNSIRGQLDFDHLDLKDAHTDC